jgi:hypothetical protein
MNTQNRTPASRSTTRPRLGARLRALALPLLPLLGLPAALAQTTVQLTDDVVLSGVPPLGIHLNGDNYYDPPIKKARNQENFEGSILRTVSRVDVLAANKVRLQTAIDESLADAYIALPTNYQILSGPNAFQKGSVTAFAKTDFTTRSDGTRTCKLELTLDKNFTPNSKENGIWIDALDPNAGFVSYGNYSAQRFSFNTAMFSGDVKFAYGQGHTRFGKNALELNGSSAAAIYKFYVTESNEMAIPGKWQVRLRYRAKSGSPTLRVDLGSGVNQTVTGVGSSWALFDQTFDFNPATVPSRFIVNVQATGGSILIDDVEIFTRADTGASTVFRDEYLAMLRELKPGTARYLVNRTDRMENRLGSRLDNYAVRTTGKPDKVDFGMHEFYQLAAEVKFDPWYTLPGSLTKEEIVGLVEYLAAPSNVGWGAKRAALGRNAPWTDSLGRIYLQFGNEWITFAGTGYNGQHYWEGLIAAAKASPHYNSKIKFVTDVQGGAAWNIGNTPSTDLVCMNSYLMFGAYKTSIDPHNTPQKLASYLLANPWQYWTTSHSSVTRAEEIIAAGKEPSVYEGGNFHTTFGDASVDTINDMLTSHVGGVASVHQMLLMTKLYGARAQNSFNLSQFDFSPGGSFGDIPGKVRLWGGLLDQREGSRRYRPRLLVLRAANQVIGGDLVNTVQGGADNNVNLTVTGSFAPGYEYRKDGIQSTITMKPIASYGFKQGNRRGLILINQDTVNNRTAKIQFNGTSSPATASYWRVAPDDLFADNEPERATPQVVLETGTLSSFSSGSNVSLKPGAFMALSWTVSATSSDTPPTAALTAPADGASFASGSAVTVTATASDDKGVSGVDLFVNGQKYGATDTSSPYSWSVTGLAVGVHDLYVTAKDTINQTGSSPVRTITVTGAGTVYQAESLPRTQSDTVTTYNEAGASGGSYDHLAADAVGDYVEYTLHVATAGAYDISVAYKGMASRGIARLKIDGANQGSTFDQRLNPGFQSVSLGSKQLSAGNHTFRFEVVGTSGSGYSLTVDAITLSGSAAPQPAVVQVEVENLPHTQSDAVTTYHEAGASGGSYDHLAANAVGDYVEYTVNVPVAGTYAVALGYKAHNSRGICQLKIDGANQGSTFDQRLNPGFQSVSLGSRQLSAGNHTFRLQVTGTSGTGYSLSADNITLTP